MVSIVTAISSTARACPKTVYPKMLDSNQTLCFLIHNYYEGKKMHANRSDLTFVQHFAFITGQERQTLDTTVLPNIKQATRDARI